MINTNYEKLYIEGGKSGEYTITLSSNSSISVSLDEHTSDLNGMVSVDISDNNTKSPSISVSYSDLYLNGETYSATLNAYDDNSSLSIPIVINCSDNLIYIISEPGENFDVTKENTYVFESLPVINSAYTIAVSGLKIDVSDKIEEDGNRVTIKFDANELENYAYLMVDNDLTQRSLKLGEDNGIVVPDDPEISGKTIYTYKNPGNGDPIKIALKGAVGSITFENVGWSYNFGYSHMEELCTLKAYNASTLEELELVIYSTFIGGGRTHEQHYYAYYTDEEYINVILEFDLKYDVDAYPTPYELLFGNSDLYKINSKDYRLPILNNEQKTYVLDHMYGGNRSLYKALLPKPIKDGIPLTSLSGVFVCCESLEDISSLSNLDTGNVVLMDYTFAGCDNLSDITPLKDWDTGNVKRLYRTFAFCPIKDLTPLANWDTGNVDTMSYLFDNCIKLTDLSPLANWDTGNVKRLYRTFAFCPIKDLTPLANWDTSKVENMSYMLWGCELLETIPLLDYTTVGNTSNAFSKCYKLTNLGGFKNLKVSMDLSYSPLLTHDSLMNVINNLATVTTSPVLKLHKDSLAKLSDDEIMIAINKGWDVDGYVVPETPEGYSEEIYTYKVVDGVAKIMKKTYNFTSHASGGNYDGEVMYFNMDLTNLSAIDADTGEEIELIPVEYGEGAPYNDIMWTCNSNKTTLNLRLKYEFVHDWWNTVEDITGYIEPTDNIPNPGHCLFMGSTLYSVNGYIHLPKMTDEWWNTKQLSEYSFHRMFNQCVYLTKCPTIITNNRIVTDMSYMFDNGYSLYDISALVNLDTSNATNMRRMLAHLSYLTDLSPISNWDTSKVTDMWGMFANNSYLADLTPIANWDTSKVTDMGQMFSMNYSLSDISALANWDTSKVIDMSFMFYDCTDLSNISALANWDTSNVTDMSFMFRDCMDLSDISALANWDTSNVNDMSSMFALCELLSDISPLANWDTSNVNDMSSMFYSCDSLVDASLANWDTSNVTDMYGMFRLDRCMKKLSLIDMSSIDSLYDAQYMLSYCEQLEDCGGFKNLKVSMGLSSSSLLTYNSLMNIINNLATVTTSPVLDLHSKSLAKLSDMDIAVATRKGWVVS